MGSDLLQRRSRLFNVFGLILLPLVILFLSSCAPAAEKPWQADDLRALDPLDAPDPALDLLAVYTRSLGLQDQIRLDFLDLPETAAEDVYIALDTQPGGARTVYLGNVQPEPVPAEELTSTDLAYDLLIVVPAQGEPSVIDVTQSGRSSRFRPRVVRDPQLDTLTVTLGRFDLPAKYSLQVFVTAPGAHTPADQTSTIASDAAPPQRASLLMAFSQAFVATTPAQTLRRWDGAHTGPYGERHGLLPLVDAAAANHVPLVLLDLKAPASLSALGLTGGIDQIKEMVRNRLLTLPDVIYGEPTEKSLSHSVSAAQAFGLSTGKFVYGAGDPGAGYDLQFFPDPQAASPLSMMNWNGQKFLGIPSPAEEQTTPDGPTLGMRRTLITAAFEGDFVVLGGDLPDSTWGDSNAGPAGLRYIAAHPWIQPLDADALLALPSRSVQADPRLVQERPLESIAIHNSQGQTTGLDSVALQKKILSRLESAPENPLTDSAWEMYFLLTKPAEDPRLAELNAQYLGDINILLTAADWGDAPAAQSTCSVDLNFDLLPDCVLADGKFFAVFESDGGRLSYLFSHDGNGVHQIVAPGWQFTTGLSDRTLWQTELGPAADPSQIPGALTDADAPWRTYAPLLNSDGSATFTSSDGRVKTFHLTEDGILLDPKGTPSTLKSGLALDPWHRFTPNWGRDYKASAEAGSLSWQLSNGPSVQVDVPQGTLHAFNDALQFIGRPEDPNQEFPPGHYLPSPLALLEFPAAEGPQVLLRVK